MADPEKTEEADESIKGHLIRIEAVVSELDEDFEGVRASLDALSERVEAIEEKLHLEDAPDLTESAEEAAEKGNEVVGLEELEGRIDAIEEALDAVGIDH